VGGAEPGLERVARFVQNVETMKKGGRAKGMESDGTAAGRSASGRVMRCKQLALSTGQAARYCYVTSYTIVNWIHSGKLKAQKTAGGQYRIRLGELREFMRENEMQTDLLDEEENVRPYCWEFHCQLGTHLSACDDCLVYRSGAERCYELRGEVSLSECLFNDCTNCEHYQNWGPHGVRTNSLESPPRS
jgi:excisionase family DNA binding protein